MKAYQKLDVNLPHESAIKSPSYRATWEMGDYRNLLEVGSLMILHQYQYQLELDDHFQSEQMR